MEPSAARACKNFWKSLFMAKVIFLGGTTLYHIYLYPIVPALRKIRKEKSVANWLISH